MSIANFPFISKTSFCPWMTIILGPWAGRFLGCSVLNWKLVPAGQNRLTEPVGPLVTAACVRQSPQNDASDIEFNVAANTVRYCVAHRTMPRIYKTLKAGVSFVKLITNNNCETLVREHCELTMPAGWIVNPMFVKCSIYLPNDSRPILYKYKYVVLHLIVIKPPLKPQRT